MKKAEVKVIGAVELDGYQEAMAKLEKLEELSKQVAEELKKFHPHMTVVITTDHIQVDESVIGVPIGSDDDGR